MVKLFKLEAKAAALSPARQRLQDLLNQKANCEHRAESLRIALSRLVDPVKEADAAAAELAAFDQRNADAQLSWARDGLRRTDRPQVDTDARQALIIAKQTTAENAAAARSASSQLGAEIHAEDMAAKTFEVPIAATIAEIVIETATGKLLDELRDAVAVAVRKQVRVKAAFDELVRIAHSGPLDAMKPVFTMVENFSEVLRLAAAPPAPDGAADRLDWARFSEALGTDSSAELKFWE